MSVLPQLEVDVPSGFNAVVGSFKAKTAIGVGAVHPSMWSRICFNAVVGSFKAKTAIGVGAVHPSMWSRISEEGKQLYTDLLSDVERTLTCPLRRFRH